VVHSSPNSETGGGREHSSPRCCLSFYILWEKQASLRLVIPNYPTVKRVTVTRVSVTGTSLTVRYENARTSAVTSLPPPRAAVRHVRPEVQLVYPGWEGGTYTGGVHTHHGTRRGMYGVSLSFLRVPRG